MKGALTQEIKDKIILLSTQLPNVTSVAWGRKIIDGVWNGDFAIVVAVKEKKDLSKVPLSEHIPTRIIVDGESIKTDVIQIESHHALSCSSTCGQINNTQLANRQYQQNIKGGISMSSRNNGIV